MNGTADAILTLILFLIGAAFAALSIAWVTVLPAIGLLYLFGFLR